MGHSLSLVFKDLTANSTHVVSALGNEKPKRRRYKPVSTAYVQKDDFCNYVKVAGVNDELGMAFGWGVVSTQNGEPYFDLQGDHIPEQAMLEASADFMEHGRVAKEMHEGGPNGSVVFAFPLTAEIAKALGIETKTTGLLIAMKPSDPAVLAKFKSGEYAGFSIGGKRIKDRSAE